MQQASECCLRGYPAARDPLEFLEMLSSLRTHRSAIAPHGLVMRSSRTCIGCEASWSMYRRAGDSVHTFISAVQPGCLFFLLPSDLVVRNGDGMCARSVTCTPLLFISLLDT